MVTIKDIAEECNVSITTVSNVLNGKAKVGEKTKQRILEVIEKRGYRPNTIAQGLRSQKTKNIAIIADDIAQFFYTGNYRRHYELLRTAQLQDNGKESPSVCAMAGYLV